MESWKTQAEPIWTIPSDAKLPANPRTRKAALMETQLSQHHLAGDGIFRVT